MNNRSNILVVDDELGPRESLRMILKPSYDVYTAENGAAALKLVEEHPIDLITLDLKMPGLSGMDMLERVRQSNSDVMVIIVTGYGTFKSVVEAIRLDVFDYISKPFNIPEIVSVVQRCLEMRETKLLIRDLFCEAACLLEPGSPEAHCDKIIDKISKLPGNAADFEGCKNGFDFLEFIGTLASWIDKRDPYTIGHSERVRQYTDLMARKIGLADSVRKDLQIASYLHDIGKVCISSRFMNSEGKLSSTDWAILKRHPIKSVEVIGPLKLSGNVVSAVRHHHERFDGTGYPDGLAGRDIPLGAQIISIANMYDVLTSKRPYRTAMSPAEARAEIRKNADAYFGSDLTGKFMEVFSENPNVFQHGTDEMEYDKEAPC